MAKIKWKRVEHPYWNSWLRLQKDPYILKNPVAREVLERPIIKKWQYLADGYSIINILCPAGIGDMRYMWEIYDGVDCWRFPTLKAAKQFAEQLEKDEK